MQVIAVDVGFENPIFACIEMDYSEADTDPTGEAVNDASKMLTYYELDLVRLLPTGRHIVLLLYFKAKCAILHVSRNIAEKSCIA
jgi:hypothetical protein